MTLSLEEKLRRLALLDEECARREAEFTLTGESLSAAQSAREEAIEDLYVSFRALPANTVVMGPDGRLWQRQSGSRFIAAVAVVDYRELEGRTAPCDEGDHH